MGPDFDFGVDFRSQIPPFPGKEAKINKRFSDLDFVSGDRFPSGDVRSGKNSRDTEKNSGTTKKFFAASENFSDDDRKFF